MTYLIVIAISVFLLCYLFLFTKKQKAISNDFMLTAFLIIGLKYFPVVLFVFVVVAFIALLLLYFFYHDRKEIIKNFNAYDRKVMMKHAIFIAGLCIFIYFFADL